MLLFVSCTDFLSILAPGIDPGAELSGEGVAGDGQHLADGGFAHSLDFVPFGIIDINPGTIFHDKNRGTEPPQLTDVGAESHDSLSILVINVVPALGGLDIADALRLKTGNRKQHRKKDNRFPDEMFHNSMLVLNLLFLLQI